MNLKELRELIDLVQKSDVTELELEKAGVRVRIKKEPAGGSAAPARENASAPAAVPASGLAPQTAGTPPPQPETGKGVTLTSPVVGTFYRAPSPDSEQYVEIGSTVKKGQIVCVIEAMKLMNEIESEWDGKIIEVLVENAQSVEYGEPLFRIEPTPAG